MKNILIVDDNDDLLEVFSLYLGKNGFRVKTLSEWEQIEEAITDFRPDVIIMDISLNGADGRILCRNLKNSDRTKRVPVILVSANHNVESSLDKYLSDSFLAKPFDLYDLLSQINRLVENNSI